MWGRTVPWGRVRGYVMLKILDLLSREPMHGYAIMKKLEEDLGFTLSPGMLYPVLREMLELGFVVTAGSEGGGRRVITYEVTQHGREFLERHRGDLELFEGKIRRVRYCKLTELFTRLRYVLKNIDRLSDDDLERLRRAVSSFLEETRGLGAGT